MAGGNYMAVEAFRRERSGDKVVRMDFEQVAEVGVVVEAVGRQRNRDMVISLSPGSLCAD